MFTGLIQEMGRVKSVHRRTRSMQLEIETSAPWERCQIGDSIAVNGVCLTAVSLHGNAFTVDVMPETWRKTALKGLTVGDRVNLEPSLTLSTPLGGHLVYGDVDTVGTLVSVQTEGIAVWVEIAMEASFLQGVTPQGRIAVDGASLTVMRRSDTSFTVSLIPHSQKALLLGSQRVGDSVNIETDILAKYCRQWLLSGQVPLSDPREAPSLSLRQLAENGFL